MRSLGVCRGLAIVAGFVLIGAATPARAQVSYGYDSLYYGSMPAQSFWAGQGYSPIYTDPTTGVFAEGMPAEPRTLTPYMQPPYGSFPQTNGLPTVVNRAGVAQAQAPAKKAVVKRKGLLGRKRVVVPAPDQKK